MLDASTLVGFALVQPYPQALVWTAVEEGMVLVVPTTALATAWARTPVDRHDALAVLLALPNTVLESFDPTTARQVGLMLGLSPTPDAVRAGHVVACGLRRGWPVVTGEPDVLRHLDPGLDVDALP